MFFFRQKTAYELRIIDWSSDVCSADLILWQRRRDPVWIHRRIVETFRLQEDLMLAAIGKTHNLLLDRGTVERADGLNLARVKLPPVEVLPDQSVACRRGSLDMATKPRLPAGAGRGGYRFRRPGALLATYGSVGQGTPL